MRRLPRHTETDKVLSYIYIGTMKSFTYEGDTEETVRAWQQIGWRWKTVKSKDSLWENTLKQRKAKKPGHGTWKPPRQGEQKRFLYNCNHTGTGKVSEQNQQATGKTDSDTNLTEWTTLPSVSLQMGKYWHLVAISGGTKSLAGPGSGFLHGLKYLLWTGSLWSRTKSCGLVLVNRQTQSFSTTKALQRQWIITEALDSWGPLQHCPIPTMPTILWLWK